MATPQGVNYRESCKAYGLTDAQTSQVLSLMDTGIPFGDAALLVKAGTPPPRPPPNNVSRSVSPDKQARQIARKAERQVTKQPATATDDGRDELLKRIQELEALVAARKASALSLKVSEKGGLSVYGLGRWPVTLYASQWESLLAKRDDILAFIKANDQRLSRKE